MALHIASKSTGSPWQNSPNSSAKGECIGRIWRATLAAGCADIFMAFIFSALKGVGPVVVLTQIATGIWPGARHGGVLGPVVGLLLHFAIMSVMATVFIVAAYKGSHIRRHHWIYGVGYGVILWAVMNLVVMPLRWPSIFPRFSVMETGWELYCHALVGLAITFFAPTAVNSRKFG